MDGHHRQKLLYTSSVARCSHIRTFIEGTTMTGLSVAIKIVLTRSSAIPCAIFAKIFAGRHHQYNIRLTRELNMSHFCFIYSWLGPVDMISSRGDKRGVTILADRVIAQRTAIPPFVALESTKRFVRCYSPHMSRRTRKKSRIQTK